MEQTILNIINQFGYFGVFFLIAVENIFPPIPSELILTFGGFATTVSDLDTWGVIAAATAGSVFGALILYAIGRVINAERLEQILDGKIGKILHLNKKDVQKAEGWFTKYGAQAVFFGRCIPIVRSLISVPAGMTGMKLRTFLPLTIAGTLIWNTILIYLGRFAGNAWHDVAGYIDTYSSIVLVIFIIIFGIGAAVFINARFFKKQK